MAKKEYRILIFLLFLITGQSFAQFDFESDKKQTSDFNQKIADALNENDVKKMKKILEKDPSLINTASSLSTISQYSALSGGKIPLLWDAVDRCLKNQCSYEMVYMLMNYNPNLYCVFDDLPPFYLILNYIGTHKINECFEANKLFFLFWEQPKFDYSQKYKELPPPLSYLLSINYSFLNNSFSKEYVSNEVLFSFIKKGASVNTRDINSNSIFSFAILTENTELIGYCLKNGADITIMDNSNHDALYNAIKLNNFDNVQLILNSNYPLTEKRLSAMNAFDVVVNADDKIQNILFDKLKIGIKDLENIKILVRLFPSKKRYFVSENYNRNNLNISPTEIPSFIQLFRDVVTNNDITAKNINSLITEYKQFIINSANQNGCLSCLKDLKNLYGLNSIDFQMINEKKYLENTNNISAYSEIFTSKTSVFYNRCKLNIYFEGTIVDSLGNGKGIALTSNGLFIGNFKNGKLFDGEANILYANGDRYGGNLSNGVYNGFGTLDLSNTSLRYKGNFIDGLFDGEGDDGSYSGAWRKGKRHGYGTLSYTEYLFFGLFPQSHNDRVYYENGSLIRNYSKEERELQSQKYENERKQKEAEVKAKCVDKQGETEYTKLHGKDNHSYTSISCANGDTNYIYYWSVSDNENVSGWNYQGEGWYGVEFNIFGNNHSFLGTDFNGALKKLCKCE